jgi:hypothetical protein
MPSRTIVGCGLGVLFQHPARVLAAKIGRPAIAITYSANYLFTASSLSFWCSRFSPTFQGKSATSWVSISLREALQHLFVRSPHLRPPCPSCRRAMEAGLTGHVWSMKGYPNTVRTRRIRLVRRGETRYRDRSRDGHVRRRSQEVALPIPSPAPERTR